MRLLRLILRRMWQIALVILNPNQIPHIDPAVTRRASEIILRLPDATPVDALAEHGPRAVSVHRVTGSPPS